MIEQLTPEQVREMSIEEKDRWWLENVYKGDMPQLTLRSGLVGMFLGCFLCLTNLYIGIKTGWTLGVGITSVILSFAIFKALSKIRLGREMTILENNAMQSCATAAGYMTGPLVASVPAYMMVTGEVIPMWQVITWVVVLAFMGVLFAFPLKRRFINDEQHPFPEGKACGVVLDGLHSEDPKEGLFKSKILIIAGTFAAAFTFLRSEKIMETINLKFLAIPGYVEDVAFHFTQWRPSILGTEFRSLTIGVETDLAMFAAGGLMGVKTGVSLLLGAAVNYFIIAPYLIKVGIIEGTGFRAITMWSLWGGVAMMATASLFAFFSKPRMIISAFSRLFGKKGEKSSDVLKDIELPLGLFVVGIPITGIIVVLMGYLYFDIKIWLGIVAVPLVFVFALIGVNSTALTAITPTGALGKLTQVVYAILAPGNMTTNLMTAGITGETASNASNLLMDIKPGYMLGAKPRQQAIAHVIGACVGTCVAVPVFYYLFNGDISLFGSEKMVMPGATVWKAVAVVLGRGLSALHPTAQMAVVVGAILGIVLEAVNLKTKGSFPFSAVGLGLAFILPFSTSFIMAAGAITFWLIARYSKKEEGLLNRVAVQNQETVCAGLIAGAALMGILAMAVELRL